MALTDKDREWGEKAALFLKAELRRAKVGYKELATRLQEHGLDENETTITGKLARGSFPVSFWLACLAVLNLSDTTLADL
jgi:DNA (cytosine-5)-methyltransferase 1